MTWKHRARWALTMAAVAGLATACDSPDKVTAPPAGGARFAETDATPGTDAEGVGPSAVTLGSLVPATSATGRISLSVDAVGMLGTSGTVEVNKPAGATVRAAYMAAASTGFRMYHITNSDITLDGQPVVWTLETPSSISSFNYWTDVTSLVKAKIDAAPAGLVSFTVGEPTSSYYIDGEILAVIFDDPAQTSDRTIALMFGAQDIFGDDFYVNLADPVDVSDPTLQIDMSLGISYGYQTGGTGQFSLVDVNGARMTSCAGGEDDGDHANGALITVGGLGDVNTNPAPNCLVTDPRSDDELYDLRPFVHDGDTQILVHSLNPSTDDNIFFAAFYLSVLGTVTNDTEAPACRLTGSGVDAYGRRYIEVTAQDPASGLASILVTKSVNATTVVPPFAYATKSPVVVRATKIDQALGSQVELQATDRATNVTVCDPVDVSVGRDAGTPAVTTLSGLPASEHLIDVSSGPAGLTSLRIVVNGRTFALAGLAAGTVRSVDVSSAMKPGSDNRIEFIPLGAPGGSAWALVHD